MRCGDSAALTDFLTGQITTFDMKQLSNSNNSVTHIANPSAFVATMLPKITVKAAGMRPEPTTITRVLRHRATGLYFCNGHWTKNPFQATEFIDSVEAAQTCARHGLTQVDLSMHLGKSAHDFFNTPMR